MELPKSVMSCLLAVDDLLEMLPRLYAKRDRIQARRKRDDRAIMPLFRTPLSANFASGPTFGYVTNALPPRIARVGVRFRF